MTKDLRLRRAFSLVIFCCAISMGDLALAEEDHALPGPGDYCPVGQRWPGYDPDWIEPGTITGDGETFYALCDPNEQCACPVGFDVVTTDFFMTVADDQPVPFTITVSMGLKEAISADGGDLPWLPGDTVCETPVRDFTMYIPKKFVGFGIALECDCVAMDSPYFLFFTIHSTMEPPGGFYTAGGGEPALGRFLTTVDDQWVDLVAAGILTRGDLVVSGTAQCCEHPVAVSEPGESLPAVTRLNGAHPNPFNPQTTISFTLDEPQRAEVVVYDLTGREIAVLADRTYEAGDHSVVWNGKDAMGRAVPSGTYVVRLEAADAVQARKVTLLR